MDGALREAQMVVIATSSAEEFITPEMLRHGAVVCDMSRPPNVSRRVEVERPDVLVLDGGVIEVPGKPWFGWDFGYEQGLAYACMSETMMLALERDYRDTSLGTDSDAGLDAAAAGHGAQTRVPAGRAAQLRPARHRGAVAAAAGGAGAAAPSGLTPPPAKIAQGAGNVEQAAFPAPPFARVGPFTKSTALGYNLVRNFWDPFPPVGRKIPADRCVQ